VPLKAEILGRAGPRQLATGGRPLRYWPLACLVTLSGPSPSTAAGAPLGGALEPKELLDRFLAGSNRQRQREWPQLQQLGPKLFDPLWQLLSSLERQASNGSIGLLLQWLAQDPQQLQLLESRWPGGWLPNPGPGIPAYGELQKALLLGQFEEADRLTSAFLRQLAGTAAEQRGYVYYSEVAAIPRLDLSHLDDLWWFYSGGRYGFRVQRRLLEQCGGRWEELWGRLGWKAAGIWTRYPRSFNWSLEAPEGHLPLVNQLRGVRLLDALLKHPAIDRPTADR